ncbi:glycoside hydrolase family 16 protein [Xylogone sp. PMI_703]|nr:glycoside hydrolase family 16 protein [Xylogone sp. PMI_703]
MFSSISTQALWLVLPSLTTAYKLVHSYDHTNWYSSFVFETEPDPTNGFVQYISQSDAQSAGMTKIINNQVYLGVDNSTVLPCSASGCPGRKSIWLESRDEFLHGVLIGDFAHMPGSDCGLWPAFWTIRNGNGAYGEIDIIEGFSDISTAYTTLHTDPSSTCTFSPPADQETGTSNQGSTDCAGDIGCSVIGRDGSYGTSFNNNGGGVYAMEWTSSLINIYFFPRNAIPADITAGNPNPSSWGLPTANFESRYGNCDIDANFPPQTIYFDTDFCGAEAGGQAWTDWTDCATKTGYSSCEAYVAANPHAFDDAYWLVNSVKVYQ